MVVIGLLCFSRSLAQKNQYQTVHTRRSLATCEGMKYVELGMCSALGMGVGVSWQSVLLDACPIYGRDDRSLSLIEGA